MSLGFYRLLYAVLYTNVACTGAKCNNDIQSSSLNPKLNGQWPLGALLGITQRTIRVIHGLSGGRFSPRKLIPVNPKTTGDYLLLKRIEADLSQQEVAVKLGVTVHKVKAWEHDQARPLEAQWQVLAGILRLDSMRPNG